MTTNKKTFPICGVTYVSQIEHEYLHSKKLSVCANCLALGFQKSLRRCNGCQLVDYCSKDCQKTHWPKHKPFCNLVQGKGSPDAYLSSKDHDEVLRIIIDAYRLRVETDHESREEDHGIYYPGKPIDGLVWAKGDAIDDFQRFLDLIEGTDILPKWWRFEDRMECLLMAIDKESPESIFKPINQAELPTRYGGDTSIRVALAIIAEMVVGYDGKGPAKDDTWFQGFQEFLDLHPEERARLIKPSVDMAEQIMKEHGTDFQQTPNAADQ
ncbi:hypothetical protein HRR90_003640 [Exophiala dermatitidis]|uniref:MYND-type domain-containing protein n=2 Tax=Exophiala dermatitidis TaxID=5970 RepID=H6BMC9_EXODN|nr:uncharacterized protein HMPREF1120_01211 [Exophiala dermatitidis NIH/UT8656]KAJ4512184.1 hypothetical protein HRR75_005084 [Exophiala dermatitidis]EHY53010.1 hypothetical protein HMPREF1120_01211 [Exophiala dermatitidis NIH/UT8656]KAJ4515083.1 hypothetical protein HRR74_005548 [Exophiala dermatitidis]KAJ4548665.1 hypothetical protein HRR76_001254 [Exophiala dermatitidis]KAJ4550477.1 hypothetical protein HRR78_004246 [Exophiala dermatitidis]